MSDHKCKHSSFDKIMEEKYLLSLSETKFTPEVALVVKSLKVMMISIFETITIQDLTAAQAIINSLVSTLTPNMRNIINSINTLYLQPSFLATYIGLPSLNVPLGQLIVPWITLFDGIIIATAVLAPDALIKMNALWELFPQAKLLPSLSYGLTVGISSMKTSLSNSNICYAGGSQFQIEKNILINSFSIATTSGNLYLITA